MTARQLGGRATSTDLLVAEMFGPTFQGEGPSCGQQALFIRLSRCNLSCPRCDTPYTWDWRRHDPQIESRWVPADEILAWVRPRPARLVVVTGGEPLLQQQRLLPVVEELAAAGRHIEIETNGTVGPQPPLAAAVARFNVSPKLASFAAPRDAQSRINKEVLRAFLATRKVAFKFVVTGPGDLDEIDQLTSELRLEPIWIMPVGTSAERTLAISRAVADDVLTRGWHLTTRMHVLLWGDARGR